MCGIVGYTGPRKTTSVLLSGLQRLEYRGYDSAGIAVHCGKKIYVERASGKLHSLQNQLADAPDELKESTSPGIGHTRWATHGAPSEENAHPHTVGTVSIIHNGIIENYASLRMELEEQGASFKSETDSEVAAHLLHEGLGLHEDPLDALAYMTSRLLGSFAILAIDTRHPDSIFVARSSSPLLVGKGEGEFFLASDIPAILDFTREILVLEDGDLAVLNRETMRVVNHGEEVQREWMTITWDAVTAQKSGFKHYMLKEIHEQVRASSDTLRGRVCGVHHQVFLDQFPLSTEEAQQIRRILLVGCGTAWHACLAARFFFESHAGIPCEVDYASEFRYRDLILDDNTLVIAISQSGETADTLAAINKVKGKARCIAICNVMGASLTRLVEGTLYTQAGPEISVASTKAFTTQLVAARLLALYLGQVRGTLKSAAVQQMVSDLLKLPGAIDTAVHSSGQMRSIAKIFHSARGFLFLGRGLCYPIALEGALKLKEISYIHAEGYPAGEIKHGPLALIDEELPVVVLLQRDNPMFEKTFSNLREVDARMGRVVVITDSDAIDEVGKYAEQVVTVPYISRELSPVIMTVPLQLLAYHVADINGTDVDLPRNLAKSVTVE